MQKQFLDSCKIMAQSLGLDFEHRPKPGEINMLANKYCEALDNNDEKNKSIYCAALAIRFNSSMDKLYRDVVKKTYSGTNTAIFDYDDLPSIFLERLDKACKYRAWQEKEEIKPKLNKKGEIDKRFSNRTTLLNAQQCINQVINTKFFELTGGVAKFDNKKANLCCSRLDKKIGEHQDGSEKTRLETVADTNEDTSFQKMLVQNLFNEAKYGEAIISDVMLFGPVGREGNYENTIVRNLRAYIEDDLYKVLLKKNYNIKEDFLETALDNFKKMSGPKLHLSVQRARTELQHIYHSIR